MRYITIGKEEMPYSRLALGSTYFGTEIDESTVYAMIDRFIELGGTTIDTARVYGQDGPGKRSASEEVIGAYLSSTGVREHMAIVTKGAHPDGNWKSRITLKDVQSDVQQSLEALRCTYVDLYFLHRDDPMMPVDEIVDIVNESCSSDMVKNIGVSNWDVKRIQQANTYAEKHKRRPFVASEIQWSLATCTPRAYGDTTVACMDDISFEWYGHHDFPVFAFSSQAKGLFSKAINQGYEALNEKSRIRFLTNENRLRIERVRQLCDALSLPVTPTILSYITSQRFPTVAIVGCTHPGQLEDSLADPDLVLDNNTLTYLFNGGSRHAT
ncbi:MAG: aldo/keto reductase [Sphaerochaetaceae bacterium]|nr:aldo/keto reductase [Sphaerochaetaceae bacterium]MDD5076526.1 aldo/keto reductase [Sphaerochaetaceae bacterium]